jgi:hypothetical protein
MKDHLLDIAYLAFGRHTGLNKDWFGLLFYVVLTIGLFGVAVVIIN